MRRSDHRSVGTFEVEQIVASRTSHGKRKYKVRWAGHTEDDDTWEPPEHLCPDTIEEYGDEVREEGELEVPDLRPETPVDPLKAQSAWRKVRVNYRNRGVWTGAQAARCSLTETEGLYVVRWHRSKRQTWLAHVELGLLRFEETDEEKAEMQAQFRLTRDRMRLDSILCHE